MTRREKIIPVNRNGFTLLEILLVVAAISILAGIVILAINPAKQLAETRNAQRRVDVNTIINGIYQYALDNNGSFPSGIREDATCANADDEICKTGEKCSGTDLSGLTTNAKYLVAIPTDPSATGTGSGYDVRKLDNRRIEVCAPNAENDATISVTR